MKKILFLSIFLVSCAHKIEKRTLESKALDHSVISLKGLTMEDLAQLDSNHLLVLQQGSLNLNKNLKLVFVEKNKPMKFSPENVLVKHHVEKILKDKGYRLDNGQLLVVEVLNEEVLAPFYKENFNKNLYKKVLNFKVYQDKVITQEMNLLSLGPVKNDARKIPLLLNLVHEIKSTDHTFLVNKNDERLKIENPVMKDPIRLFDPSVEDLKVSEILRNINN